MSDKDIKLVKDFIFNDDVQLILSGINDNLMNFNILEITGMGNQEIKHSNILGWLFSDSEHNLEHHILDGFLKKIIEENRKDVDDTFDKKKALDNLQSYIYLPEKKKEITIFREKDNIDLLIVDEANKVIITIENKVYASERKDGDDGGQLEKYENFIKDKYPSDNYKHYFIFLTIDLEEPSKGEWLKASHQMVTDVIDEILKSKTDITTKTIIILESYIDILKRNGIVADEELEVLCKKMWDNPEYKKALEVIHNFKPDIFSEISKYLQEKLSEYDSLIELDDSTRSIIRFKSKSWDCDAQTSGSGWTKKKNVLLYELQNTNSGLDLKLIIGPSEDKGFREEIFKVAKSQNRFKPGKTLSDKYNQIWKKYFISKEDINNKTLEDLKKMIDDKLEEYFLSEGNDYNKNNDALSIVMRK